MSETIITNPTYMEHIRHFFEDIDLEHMFDKNIDLSTYEKLKAESTDVFLQTEPPNANMPPSADRKWSPERSESFFNWIRNGHPFGTPIPQLSTVKDVDRIRKDVRSLSEEEKELLKKAFAGIMGRDPDEPESYFSLAGLHWFPKPIHCKHHENRYNPWHRAYLLRFENALRSVEGCENVTLPYWDITTKPPDFLFSAPFDSYTLPKDVHSSYPKGYTTQRYNAQDILDKVNNEDIPNIISDAMGEAIWENFVTYTGRGIEAAHDAGHSACGTTLTNPDAASFDPLFWFFHANWDRLWWEWQQVMQATTLWKFRSTITGSTRFLEAPFNELDPFSLTADQTIDLTALNVDYAPPEKLTQESATLRTLSARTNLGSMAIASGLRVHSEPMVSIRLKGIDRLSIPGSFRAVLMVDGQPIAHRTFFQSTETVTCPNCREKAKINLDFLVESQQIRGKNLSAKLEVITPKDGVGSQFPLRAAGNPTLNIRVLLQEQR